MMFVVAENNEPSIKFYKRRGAEDLSQEEGWRLFKFSQNSLFKMATPAEEWLDVDRGAAAAEEPPGSGGGASTVWRRGRRPHSEDRWIHKGNSAWL